MKKKDIEETKKAFQEAEESLREKKRKKVKDLVIKTLTKIDKIDDDIIDLKKQIAELEKDRKVLKLDIDDLKEGRLDRIEERQKKDKRANKVSVFVVKKDKEHSCNNWWKQPYVVFDQPSINTAVTYPTLPNWGIDTTLYCDSGTTTTNNNSFIGYSSTVDALYIDNSLVKFDTAGAYNINGTIINLR